MVKNWNPLLYQDTQRYQFEYGENLINELLKPQCGETILDLGCGTGQLTKIIFDKGSQIIGIDNSPTMINQALKNFPKLEFVVANGADFKFSNFFDAVYSHATLHWILEANKVIDCIAHCLKPGGRFVAQFDGKGSLAKVLAAADAAIQKIAGTKIKREKLFYFPSIDEYSTLLESYGFEVSYAALLNHTTKLEEGKNGLNSWINTFGHGLFPNMEKELVKRVIALMEDMLMPVLYKNGDWYVDYKRIRILAFKLS